VLSGTLLEQLFNKTEVICDAAEIRRAGKIQWHLEAAEKFITSIVAADHQAVEQIKDAVCMNKLERKAAASDLLFPEEMLETAPIS